MKVKSIGEKIAIGILLAEYLMLPLGMLASGLAGEPHLDTGPSYPIAAFSWIAMIVLWPCCLAASFLSREKKWRYVTATLCFPLYFQATVSILAMFKEVT